MVLFQPALIAGRAPSLFLGNRLSRISLWSIFCRPSCHRYTPPRGQSLSISPTFPLRHAASVFRRSSSNSLKRQAPVATTIEDFHTLPPKDDTKSKSKNRAFPKTNSKSVAYWLLGSAASVFGIVVFGGLTRLTESGYADSAPRTSSI